MAEFKMAPPTALPAELPLLPSAPRAWLPVKALLETVSVPYRDSRRRRRRAPPTRPDGLVLASPTARLLDRTSLERVRLPKFKIAPPVLARTGELPLARPSRHRHPGDGHGHAAADVEDPAGVVAADGQSVRARAVDGQVVRDAQLAAGQRDRAVASRGGEVDQVGAGQGVGVEDRLPQRAGAAVGEVLDRERARHGPVLQGLQPRRDGPGLRGRCGRRPRSRRACRGSPIADSQGTEA